MLGDGNNTVTVGNGNNVIVEGNGNDDIDAGNGDNLIVAGLGVQLTRSGDSLHQVLDDWIAYGKEASNVADIRSRLSVTYNKRYTNTMDAGSGLDWFWATNTQDHSNVKKTDLQN